jgi:16S rRNA (uracil1498-N3)-methyltransferase
LRLFVPPADILKRQRIVLSAEKSHYLLNVLRAGKGDRFTVIDGRGGSYLAEIADIVRQGSSGQASPPGSPALLAVIEIRGEPAAADAGDPCGLVLCQGLLKGEKMDLVIQKATELGVSGIQPLVTERCIVRHTRKVPRWRKIAEEAAEQCGRATIPAIHEPQDLATFLAAPCSPSGIILWEQGGLPLAEALARLTTLLSARHPVSATDAGRSRGTFAVIVGPEGGLSGSEVMEAQSRGFVPVTLGSRTLRAETAAIVGIALTQHILEHGRP